MTQPLAEVKADDVLRLFRSVSFRSSLRQAAAFTNSTGYESAFRVARDFYDGSCCVSRVREGTSDSFDTEDRTYEGELADFDFGGQNITRDKWYCFFALHFHPDFTECPEPSLSDIKSSQSDHLEGQMVMRADVRPVIAVAHILDDGRIVTLLYQKRIAGNIEQTKDFWETESNLARREFYDPSDVVSILETSGLFHADSLMLERRYAYRPAMGDYDKLRRFVHTPSRVSVTDVPYQSLHIQV